MNPEILIHKQQQIIYNLKNELPYSNNKLRDAQRINTLIDVVESFNDVLVSKYETNTLETLIYALIYEWLLMFDVAMGKPIPLKRMVNEIDNAISYGAELKKTECISLLEDHEMVNKIKDKTIFDGDNADFDGLLTKLVQQFKMQMIWKR